MIKYEVGIEVNPNGEVRSSKGLISGREVREALKLVKINKKRNTYLHIKYDRDKRIVEIWKLTKKEYDDLRCGFGLSDFGEFLKSSGLI